MVKRPPAMTGVSYGAQSGRSTSRQSKSRFQWKTPTRSRVTNLYCSVLSFTSSMTGHATARGFNLMWRAHSVRVNLTVSEPT